MNRIWVKSWIFISSWVLTHSQIESHLIFCATLLCYIICLPTSEGSESQNDDVANLKHCRRDVNPSISVQLGHIPDLTTVPRLSNC